jgi:hypothetical protein
LNGHRWLLLVAAVLAGASLVPLLIGLALDSEWLETIGTLFAYFGISWIGSGAFAGIATSHWAKGRGQAHATALGVLAGIAVGTSVLVGASALIAAADIIVN